MLLRKVEWRHARLARPHLQQEVEVSSCPSRVVLHVQRPAKRLVIGTAQSGSGARRLQGGESTCRNPHYRTPVDQIRGGSEPCIVRAFEGNLVEDGSLVRFEGRTDLGSNLPSIGETAVLEPIQGP